MIRIGTAGWKYKDWDGIVYPKPKPRGFNELEYLAQYFSVVEINSSYYAIPAARNAVRWVERTPPGFLFNVKAYSLMTGHHPRRETLPAELQLLLPRSPRLTRRGEVEAGVFSPEALDQTFRLFREAITPLAAAGKLGYVLSSLMVSFALFACTAAIRAHILPARR